MPESGKILDLLVVGGGINGAGVARDAAGRGLDVLLCEQHDLASHTSSSSTKLIHGGLRYLEYYDFGLVRKSLREREIVIDRGHVGSVYSAFFGGAGTRMTRCTGWCEPTLSSPSRNCQRVNPSSECGSSR